MAGEGTPYSDTACSVCARGKYAAHKGSTECLQCSESKYNEKTGQSACESCKDGEKADLGRLKCVPKRSQNDEMPRPKQPSISSPRVQGNISYVWDSLLNNGDAEEIEVEWSLSPAFESNLTESKIVSIRDTSVELSLANLSSIPVITSLTPVYARLRARNENSTSGYSLTSKAWIVADDCDNSQFFNSNFSENDEQWLVDLSMSLSQWIRKGRKLLALVKCALSGLFVEVAT